MKRQFRAGLIGMLIAGALAAPAYGQDSKPQKKPAADPNQRVCEDVTPVGSRLATKRFCGTRAEWEDKKRQDREAVEKAQTQVCVNNPATKTC